MPWNISHLKGYPGTLRDHVTAHPTLPRATREYLHRLIADTEPVPLIMTLEGFGHELRNSATGGITQHINITLTSIG
jgi:hypothetical protein